MYVNLNIRYFLFLYAYVKVSTILILITNMILIEFIRGNHDGLFVMSSLSYQVVVVRYIDVY